MKNLLTRIVASRSRARAARRLLPFLAVAVGCACAGGQAIGQVWSLDPAATAVTLDTTATTVCATACGPIFGPLEVYEPGLNGDDITYFSQALCKMAATAPCGCKAHGWARIGVRGLGSLTVRMRFEGYSRVKHRCNYPIPFYFAEAIGDIEPSTLGLAITGASGSSTVYYSGDGVSFATHDPEGGGDDWTVVGLPATSLAVGGIAMFPVASLDLPYVRGSLRQTFGGSFTTSASAVPVDVAGGSWAVIRRPPKSIGTPGHQGYYEWDYEYCGFVYNLALRLNSPIPSECEEPIMLFSQDIGADAERSDPTIEGNEAFEPFDVYMAGGSALPLPGGADGVLTDDAAVPGDIAPIVPDGVGAPSCTGAALLPATTANLDLDGTDSIDFSLLATMAASPQMPNGALMFPIPFSGDSFCVHRVENLIISYDDDTAEHFVGGGLCAVPIGSGSPIFQTYGSAARQDEVLGLALAPTFAPFPYVNYPLRDEASVHVNMAPNPPPSPTALPTGAPLSPQDADDDVDGLDLVASVGGCGIWLFGVDHEARATFPAGAAVNVYQWLPGGGPPALVISGVSHLGLLPATDLRDFELVRMNDPSGADGEVYALVFSVAPNDPLTTGDESGGLNPAMVYYSFLTGSSFPLLDFPLDDAIDGIAAWCSPLGEAIIIPCPADITGDGLVNVNDLLMVINNWNAPGGPADVNGDGIVNVNDLLAVINAWGPCP